MPTLRRRDCALCTGATAHSSTGIKPGNVYLAFWLKYAYLFLLLTFDLWGKPSVDCEAKKRERARVVVAVSTASLFAS